MFTTRFTHPIALILVALSFAIAGEEPKALPAGIEQIKYTGWDDSLQIKWPESQASAVVATAVGGRIVNYSLGDESIIFEVPGSAGKTTLTSKNFWVGGYQIDVGPEVRNIPGHVDLWQSPCKWECPAPFTIKSTSDDKAGMSMGVRLQKDFTADATSKTAGIKIVQRMRNISEKDTNYCLWDRTLCKGGGYVFFPINKNSRFAAGWSIRERKNNMFSFNGTTPSSPNVQVLDGVLVAQALGKEGKIGADSDAGWIAYVRDRLLYIKAFPYYKDGNYSDGGNSVEFYWSPQVGEVEPLSPEIKLSPNQEYEFTETWMLVKLDEPADTFEKARALVERVKSLVQSIPK